MRPSQTNPCSDWPSCLETLVSLALAFLKLRLATHDSWVEHLEDFGAAMSKNTRGTAQRSCDVVRQNSHPCLLPPHTWTGHSTAELRQYNGHLILISPHNSLIWVGLIFGNAYKSRVPFSETLESILLSLVGAISCLESKERWSHNTTDHNPWRKYRPKLLLVSSITRRLNSHPSLDSLGSDSSTLSHVASPWQLRQCSGATQLPNEPAAI